MRHISSYIPSFSAIATAVLITLPPEAAHIFLDGHVSINFSPPSEMPVIKAAILARKRTMRVGALVPGSDTGTSRPT